MKMWWYTGRYIWRYIWKQDGNSLEKVKKAKKDVKKATYLPPRIDLTMSDLKNASTQMTIGK